MRIKYLFSVFFAVLLFFSFAPDISFAEDSDNNETNYFDVQKSTEVEPDSIDGVEPEITQNSDEDLVDQEVEEPNSNIPESEISVEPDSSSDESTSEEVSNNEDEGKVDEFQRIED